MIRINKFLAKCNVGSRRQSEEYISAGLVKVNNVVCTDLSTQINPVTDTVTYNGKKLEFNPDKIYLMMNKPKNYLVTARDDFNRKTVFDLLPDFGVHLFPIGRLDYMSEGLLLLTTDGDFANRVIHPRHKLPKSYKVTIKGTITPAELDKLRNVKEMDGTPISTPIINVKKRSDEKTAIRMTIFEGKKRQIRRMMKMIHKEVTELKRLKIGDVELKKLPVGMWRHLKPGEVMSLQHYEFKRGR